VIERMAVLGVGLIGGSLAKAAKLSRACHEVVGWGRSPQHLQIAQDLKTIDRYELDLPSALAGANLVVVAVPPGAMGHVFEAMAGHLSPDTVVTDVGSTKASVVAAAHAKLRRHISHFVPGHPIAGGEQGGVQHADSRLFRGRRVILTPLEDTYPPAVALVRGLWERVGAEVVEMDVDHHDHVLAATSHLPHLLAYALVDTLATMDEKREIFAFAAGGFRDFTRIASSDPQLWHDILLANRGHLLEMMDRFQTVLGIIREAIAREDGQALLNALTRAKEARDHFARLMDERSENT
jgi:prephenate dehydrogenase